MKLNERNNYIIALMFSLGFHALLLLLFVSGYLTSQENQLETFPVGMVEIAKDSPDGGLGMAGSVPKESGNTPVVPDAPGQKNQEKDKTAVKPQVLPKAPAENTVLIPRKDKSEPFAVPGKIANPAGVEGAGSQGTGGSGGGTGKPLGFGSGEGMVTVLGPLPSYPKSAMNEGVEGNVALHILVKADGNLEDIQVSPSATDSRLVNAAVLSIKRAWKFKPVTQNYYIDLIVSFHDSEVTRKFINSESRP